jgi:hypothetical protein
MNKSTKLHKSELEQKYFSNRLCKAMEQVKSSNTIIMRKTERKIFSSRYMVK